MKLCPLDTVAVRKRMETIMGRLLCSGAERVVITVTVAGTNGDDDKRSASILLLAQEIGRSDPTEIMTDRLEAAAASYDRMVD